MVLWNVHDFSPKQWKGIKDFSTVMAVISLCICFNYYSGPRVVYANYIYICRHKPAIAAQNPILRRVAGDPLHASLFRHGNTWRCYS